jgi:hypothetical protein
VTGDWRPDPTRRHTARYWDGARWTIHVVDTGEVFQDDPYAWGWWQATDELLYPAHTNPDAQTRTSISSLVAKGCSPTRVSYYETINVALTAEPLDVRMQRAVAAWYPPLIEDQGGHLLRYSVGSQVKFQLGGFVHGERQLPLRMVALTQDAERAGVLHLAVFDRLPEWFLRFGPGERRLRQAERSFVSAVKTHLVAPAQGRSTTAASVAPPVHTTSTASGEDWSPNSSG